VSDDSGDTWVYPNRLDDGRAASRLDRCRLGFVLQASGPATKVVAQNGPTRNDEQMHAAANPRYWEGTPLVSCA
jgi:hypothetical protein